jgi:hypothetical protein
MTEPLLIAKKQGIEWHAARFISSVVGREIIRGVLGSIIGRPQIIAANFQRG